MTQIKKELELEKMIDTFLSEKNEQYDRVWDEIASFNMAIMPNDENVSLLDFIEFI